MSTTPDAKAIDAKPQHLVMYVGGYGPVITWIDVDPATGALAESGNITPSASSPSFLAFAPDGGALYAVSEAMNRVGAYTIDRATGVLHFVDDVSSAGQGPAHLSVDRDGKFVLVANYTDGTAAVLTIRADRGLADAPVQTLAPGANAHMIVTNPSNRFAFVPCLGSDYVAQYRFDNGMLTDNGKLATAAGAGPRHIAFGKDGTRAYLVDEKSSTVMTLALDDAGRLTALQTIATVPAGTTNTGAEIAVHPTGAFVFASNRGDDSIARFGVAPDGTLSLLGRTPTGGKTPRSFTIDPSGRFLYVANQDSNSVVPFAIATDGTLQPLPHPVAVMKPTFVGILAL